ncbi:hypothetical protein NM688_g3438 [Phlebia brevispora]|uniref:Uncharacterized protein n=1 Tax=Phlebia brevispora TaxID=194682 RepID=A0ACC1T6E8_9APHY|nr:hypothetical protein NM688_g3438 [Phlebia brevispora]
MNRSAQITEMFCKTSITSGGPTSFSLAAQVSTHAQACLDFYHDKIGWEGFSIVGGVTGKGNIRSYTAVSAGVDGKGLDFLEALLKKIKWNRAHWDAFVFQYMHDLYNKYPKAQGSSRPFSEPNLNEDSDASSDMSLESEERDEEQGLDEDDKGRDHCGDGATHDARRAKPPVLEDDRELADSWPTADYDPDSGGASLSVVPAFQVDPDVSASRHDPTADHDPDAGIASLSVIPAPQVEPEASTRDDDPPMANLCHDQAANTSTLTEEQLRCALMLLGLSFAQNEKETRKVASPSHNADVSGPESKGTTSTPLSCDADGASAETDKVYVTGEAPKKQPPSKNQKRASTGKVPATEAEARKKQPPGSGKKRTSTGQVPSTEVQARTKQPPGKGKKRSATVLDDGHSASGRVVRRKTSHASPDGADIVLPVGSDSNVEAIDALNPTGRPVRARKLSARAMNNEELDRATHKAARNISPQGTDETDHLPALNCPWVPFSKREHHNLLLKLENTAVVQRRNSQQIYATHTSSADDTMMNFPSESRVSSTSARSSLQEPLPMPKGVRVNFEVEPVKDMLPHRLSLQLPPKCHCLMHVKITTHFDRCGAATEYWFCTEEKVMVSALDLEVHGPKCDGGRDCGYAEVNAELDAILLLIGIRA